jgi:glycosyltransferase involved in cell wall biosynthesis
MSQTTVVLDARVVCGAGGGPDKTILNSPRFLEPFGYRMLCAYMHPPRDPGFETLRAKADAWGAPLISIPDRGPWDWRVASRLLEVCRRERVEVWHGHDYKSNALGLLLRRRWPMRLVTTLHGWVRRTVRTPLYYAIDRLTLPHYERVVCVSEDLHRAARACGVPHDRCILLENAIRADEFTRRQAAEGAKARLGLPAGRMVVGAVGRLSAEKGFDLLIRVVERLLRDGIDLELWIVGEGSEEARLRALVAELGLGERIKLLGYRPETIPLYEAMDVFALSSLREGLPNVVLEAMAMEVPVVATRIAGVPNLIRHEQNGLLVEPGDAEGLAQALGRLLGDERLRGRLRRAGRTTIEAGYSFEARMARLRDIYDRLLYREEAAAPC